jgi:hypothetical protein
MLYQFAVYWDDISAYSASTSSTEITITKDINLYGGPYKCKVVGFTWADNLSNAVPASNFTVINIKSSKFVFPALAQQNISFLNRTEHAQPWIQGNLEFQVDAMAGDIDLTMTVKQFLDARTANASGTWNATGMIAMILSLDIQPVVPDERLSYRA